jgi:hypothetical protein|tara:strand:- start:300 stop:620 length:321 start_codon:yes stop_codon:yes gene_type:complete
MPEAPLKSFLKRKPRRKFDPLGSGFDIDQANALGFQRGPQGHLQSRNPLTGQILKGIKHPTFDLALETDRKLGFLPYQDRQTGAIFTFKKNPDPNRFILFKRSHKK